MLTKIKKFVENLLTAQALKIGKIGLSPNIISILGLILATASGVSFYFWNFNPQFRWAAPLLILASGFCDALDGVVARVTGDESAFGAFLDSLLDRYGEAIIITGIIMGGLSPLIIGILGLTGSLLVSYTRSKAEGYGVKMEGVGLLERPERLIILFIGGIINIFVTDALTWTLTLIVILTHLTVAQRALFFFRKMKS